MFGRARRLKAVLPLALAVTALALAGCGGDDGADDGGGAKSGDASLTWWDYFGYSPASDGAMKDLITRYQAANKGVKIKRSAIAYPDFFTKLNQGVASHTVPDIVAVDAGTIPSYAKQGAFADLSKYTDGWDVMDQFLPTVAETVKVDGKTYGVPFRSNALVLWYRPDVLEKAGVASPPTNWEELRAAAKGATSDKTAGLCFPGNKTEATTFIFLSFLWQAGGDLESMGDDASVQAFAMLDGLMKEKGVPKSVIQWAWDDVASQFASGGCSMMIAGPWVYGGVEKAKFDWKVAEVPSGPAGNNATPLGGEAWTVGANSKNVEAAWKLIQWLSKTENSAKQILEGTQSFPNRKDQMDLPEAEWSDIVPTVSKAIEHSRSRVKYGPKYTQISNAVAASVQGVLTGQKSPQDAAAETKAAIAPLLPQGG